MSAALRALILGLAVALGVAAAGALMSEPQLAVGPAITGPAPRALQPLPLASENAGPALLARSPFAPDRSRFSRSAPEPAVAVQPPDVRLVALFAAQGSPRATLLVDGRELTVGVGDPTPAGAVRAIEADAVILGEGASERRVSLFD